MKNVNQIKILISCPSDIKEEIDSINLIVNEINKTSGKHDDYTIEILNWKYDSYTDVGSDGQEVINNQLLEHADIIIGIFWLRAGTPTKRDKSGTIEEINLAISKAFKYPMIYFKTSPPDNIYDIDQEQFNIIKNFKMELADRGVLYKEFNSPDNFENLFRINLINLINDKLTPCDENSENNLIKKKTDKQSLALVKTNKYSDIANLIYEVENKDEKKYNVDVDDLFEQPKIYLENVTKSLGSMTSSMEFISEKMSLSTAEVDRIVNIKDTKLREIKKNKLINNLSSELEEFYTRINDDLPFFSENFKLVGKSYSDILLIYSDDESQDAISLREAMRGFRDNVLFSLENSAELLKAIVNLPLLNFKFNQSKRQTELAIKNLTKETMEGLIILDEAIGI